MVLFGFGKKRKKKRLFPAAPAMAVVQPAKLRKS